MSNWSTQDELHYLDTIGEHTQDAPKSQPQINKHKISMLNRYLDLMPRRTNWHNLDVEAIHSHALQLLNNLTKDSTPCANAL